MVAEKNSFPHLKRTDSDRLSKPALTYTVKGYTDRQTYGDL
jgi:hypothetical protein